MKYSIALLIVCLFNTGIIAQSGNYGFSNAQGVNGQNRMENAILEGSIQGIAKNPVSDKKVYEAKMVSDICANYPSAWIDQYISTQVTATSNGKVIKIMGKNQNLTNAQRELLKAADLNTNILLEVLYKEKNSITGKFEEGKLNHSIVLVPEKEAFFPEGEVSQYLVVKAKKKLENIDFKKFARSKVKFVINESGRVENVRLMESSGNKKVDELILELINQMPKWNPAKNRNGQKTKQEFEFLLGFMIWGC